MFQAISDPSLLSYWPFEYKLILQTKNLVGVVFLSIASMVTTAAGKELQSTVSAQRRARKKSQEKVLSEQSLKGYVSFQLKSFLSKWAAADKSRKSAVFVKHQVIWCGWRTVYHPGKANNAVCFSFTEGRYREKSIQNKSVQLVGAAQTEHIYFTSTQVKKRDTKSIPKSPFHDLYQSLLLPNLARSCYVAFFPPHF